MSRPLETPTPNPVVDVAKMVWQALVDMTSAYVRIRNRVLSPVFAIFRKIGASASRWWRGQPKAVRVAVGVLGIASLYLLPQRHIPIITTPDTNFMTLLGGVVIVYVLVALGLNVVVGWAGLLDLGYVGFYAVGAYTVAILSSKHDTRPIGMAITTAR